MSVLLRLRRGRESELSNCIERGPLGIYRVQEETPNPRLKYNDYNTLNTPSQMQRECNDVAFGEFTLSTRLKINKKKIHPSPKS